ncbi:MAG TPA: hypothetical protein PK473_03220 [Nitrosomonas sp.]|nr:hypothetical protein [Agitococcus sp.]HNA70022.1 hypothetical protein [Nitrosomonas sp.]
MRELNSRGQIEFTDYQDAIKDLQRWQDGDEVSFYSFLFELFQMAEPYQYERLTFAFPVEAKAYADWDNAEDPETFIETILAFQQHPHGDFH